ncbi:MAG: hypothetical protein RMK84_03025 [Oscillochloridaceae bacterium]|nr:hypothetical protein [Chloroflexaceae bacterium]MDW8389075.1 hypothetical protein [Oscillochloridaceae bacterium]
MSVIRLAGVLAFAVVLLALPALMVVVPRNLPNTSGGAWPLVVAGSALLGAPGGLRPAPPCRDAGACHI